jgi:S1-C subfamily serine protease
MMRLLFIAFLAFSFPVIAEPQLKQVSSGTGFFVSRKGEIVTNAHVIAQCRDPQDIQFRTNSGMLRSAKLITMDANIDLALLNTGYRPPRIASIRWMHEDIQKDEEVFLIGYPEAKAIDSPYVTQTATIKGLKGPFGEKKWLQFTDAARQGNSGGPLLDFSGNVIGVVTAKSKIMRLNQLSNRQEVIEESDIAVTSNELKNFLDSNYVHYTLDDAGYIKSTNALEYNASEYVVHIFCEVD